MPIRLQSAFSAYLVELIILTTVYVNSDTAAFALDPELTNYKSGIDVHWGGEKGSAYQEEYWYHDKLVSDTKTVYLRSDTEIKMRHNERNIGTLAGRTKVVIGADGGGQIRYEVDKIWGERLLWAHPTTPKKNAYAEPFTLGSLSYEQGTPVVGTVGARPNTPLESQDFYWRGMLDSVGDEWHVLMYADDDQSLGSLYDDAWASDGKFVLLVVNPKTPALTIRATGNDQFYTTPAWTYWTNKIHDQTTYLSHVTGDVSFELHDIYGNQIHYRINDGAWINSGASTVTLTQSSFNDGENSLQYYYEGNVSFTKTRRIVKNPSHPGRTELHGDRVWGGVSAWEKFQDRATRAPYSGRISAAQTDGGTGQTNWDALGHTGLRFGGANWPHRNFYASNNALIARHLGFTAKRVGTTKSYAQYAKEKMLESVLNQSPVGYEANNWAALAIPAADTVYRGYWDVNQVYDAAITYDVLMNGYRSDQQPSGITPVEDYFIRDQLASWVHLSALQLGGFVSPTDTGMWSTSRNIGATMITLVMPSYSTPYYGTSGIDGNTTTYSWAPFMTSNYTWKDLFLDHDYTKSTYPHGPTLSYGLEGPATTDALIRPPGTPQVWVDKTAYASFNQCGHNIYIYANLQALYGDMSKHPNLLNYLDQITAGTLYGGKGDVTIPHRQHAITVLNNRFPTAARNAIQWIQGLPSADQNSDDQAMIEAGLLGLFFYDDNYFGVEPTPTLGKIPSAPANIKVVLQ